MTSDERAAEARRTRPIDVLRVVSVVIGAWVVLGVVLGSQAALGSRMQGNPAALGASIRSALQGLLPWIPTTLIAMGVAVRFPVTSSRWKTAVPAHMLALPVASWAANVGVVLGFWVASDRWDGVVALAQAAAFWGTIQIHVAALIYGVSAGLTQAWVWLRDSRVRELRVARLESQLSRARFQALSAQIRPHFLFNTLHTIGQLWRSGRSDDAEEMLDHLGSLFQRVRTSTERPGISLGEEISMVEEYLAIEEVRFADRLKTDVRVSVEARSCVVPPLILQPLVENAIRHGISASAEASHVSVDASVADGRLVVEICDDGPGVDQPSPSPGTGTGLSNTRERIGHAYGEMGSLTLSTRKGGGTCVRIEVPAQRDPDGDFWGDE
jgi:two-component system LytT family sensor kinase